MGKPSTHELREALDRAIAMRESGQDPHFVAKTLLNLHYRLLKAERAVAAARHYLHSGQSPDGRRELLSALQDSDLAGMDLSPDDAPRARRLKLH